MPLPAIKAIHTATSNNRTNERGNVFLFILMGVILFAALSYTVAQSFRSDSTSRMSERRAIIVASDILSYTQRLERAVSTLRRKGVSENDISFDNPAVSGYTHGSAQPNKHKIFNAAGGKLRWQEPPDGASTGTWLITGSTCIDADSSLTATSCEGDSTSNEELLLILPNIDQNVCEILNNKLGTTLVTDSVGSYSSTKFTGSYADGTELILDSSINTACYTDGTSFHFYRILLKR